MNDEKRNPVLPPTYFLLAIILMILLRFLPPKLVVITVPINLIGMAPIVAGLALAVVGDRMFKRHGTTVKPFEASSAFLTSGVFGFSRNPMYLGMVLVLVGLGLILGTVVPFVVVPLFVWLMTARFIVKEEAMLQAQYGEMYDEYKRRVRRWF